MPSNKYQKKKAATQSQIYTPTDKWKKSPHITRTPATPPSTLITTLINTETASDSKRTCRATTINWQADKKSKSTWGEGDNIGQPVGCFRHCHQPS